MVGDSYRTAATPVHSEPPLKRLPLVWNPVTWLLLTAMLLVMQAAWLGYVGEENPGHANRMWGLFFAVLSAWWVYSDRRTRGVGMPYEFDAFVLFCWPIVLPYYLYRTRRWKGLLLGVSFWLLYSVPLVVSDLILLFRTD
jgi:hypothetical protein